MFGQVLTRTIVLSAVFLWTVQPAILSAFAAVEACGTCSIELTTDIELDQFDVVCLSAQMADVAIYSFSTALPVDDAIFALEAQVGAHQHLRGPPVVSLS